MIFKPNDTAFLRSDITGPVSGIQYGKMGDKVTIIGLHENMATVVNGENVSFPVKVIELVEEEVKECDATEVLPEPSVWERYEADPLIPIVPFSLSKSNKVIKSPKIIPQQTQLF